MIRTMVTRKGWVLEKEKCGSYYNMNHPTTAVYFSGDISSATLFGTRQSAIGNRPTEEFEPVYVEVNYIVHGGKYAPEPKRTPKKRPAWSRIKGESYVCPR